MDRMGSLAGTDELLREEGWIPSGSGMDGRLDGRMERGDRDYVKFRD